MGLEPVPAVLRILGHVLIRIGALGDVADSIIDHRGSLAQRVGHTLDPEEIVPGERRRVTERVRRLDRPPDPVAIGAPGVRERVGHGGRVRSHYDAFYHRKTSLLLRNHALKLKYTLIIITKAKMKNNNVLDFIVHHTDNGIFLDLKDSAISSISECRINSRGPIQ